MGIPLAQLHAATMSAAYNHTVPGRDLHLNVRAGFPANPARGVKRNPGTANDPLPVGG